MSGSSSSTATPRGSWAEEAWRVMRLTAVEDQLQGQQVDVKAQLKPTAAPQHDLPAQGDALQGHTLSPEGSYHQGSGFPAGLLRLLQLPEPYNPWQLPQGRQVLPSGQKQADATGVVPLHLPIEKEGVRLQASGEAVYVGDVAAALGSRVAFMAGVLSSEALAVVEAVDGSAALKLPGVLGFLTAADIPGSNEVYGAPLLAAGKVEWVGQPVALVVATSQAAADAGAKLVKVSYGPVPGRSPVITIDQAIAADAFYSDLPLLSAAAVRSPSQRHQHPSSSRSSPSRGQPVQQNEATARRPLQADKETVEEVAQLIAAAPRRIKDGCYSLPAQQHFYMEPQAALAEPQEDGTVRVHSSTQSLDAVQLAVAQVLQLPFNKITVVAKRLGGGFGGKASRSMPVAAAAALAALHFDRPVCYSLNRNDDFAQNPGRCFGRVLYDVGFEETGRLIAIQAQVVYRAGAYLDLSSNDAAQLVHASDSAYDLSGLSVDVKLARCNLPPHTIVRGPGYLQGVMVLEQVLEHVAALLGKDSAEVKAANFLSDVSSPMSGPAVGPIETSSCSSSSEDWVLVEDKDMSSPAESAPAVLLDEPAASAGPAMDTTAVGCAAAEDELGLDTFNSSRSSQVVTQHRPCTGSLAVLQRQLQQQLKHKQDHKLKGAADVHPGLHTTLGRFIAAECYTLPRVWHELCKLSRYCERVAAVQQYNLEHAWSKRGIAMTPVRFDCAPAPVSAAISVYGDGSVLVTHGGIEMGQGLSTKVKQAAVAALSLLLPADQRPLPLSLVRLAASNSDVVPNGGPTWSSTGSEGNVQAVRQAAAELVQQMKPYLKLGDDATATWTATLASIIPDIGFTPASAMLSAYGFYNGSVGKQQVAYSAFGAAVTEASLSEGWELFRGWHDSERSVELDMLTGERRVLSSHIHYDCGFSLNPGIDLGQVEGAFVMGLGAMLSEDVAVDESSGRLLSDSTWRYKIPTIDLIPQEFVVSFLEDAPNPHGIMSSKASGEPALMTSVSALMALQQAAAAAISDLSHGCAGQSDGIQQGDIPGGRWKMLAAPATPLNIKRHLGAFRIADILQKSIS
eukprot:gene11870-12014_t